MAILSPADLPVVMKLQSDPMKSYVLTKLGHPHVAVELSEQQFEIIIRTTGDWISGYFPHEQKLAVFYTTPLQSTYPLPADGYWVQEVNWDATATNIDLVFGAESYLFNVGSITGVQSMLLDYHLLQSYRRWAGRILGTEGRWEVLNEGTPNGPATQKIRLYPTPKGVFPVVVLYYPVVTHFRSPQARKIAMDALLAESKIVLGHIRRKLANVPSPNGGNIGLDGDALVQEGEKMLEDLTQKAINLGEPLPVMFL